MVKNLQMQNMDQIHLPISENINKKFIWFKFINPPNTKKDMDDVIKAFEKVLGF